ncbi:Phospholipase/Carboxylesterase-domain-containing protein, partial [Flammula alnicola]
FDCYSFDHATRVEDEDGLHRSVKWINEIISKEETDYGIPSERIVVGGLSQGSATSVLTTITSERPIGGLFILSGYIPFRKKLSQIATSFSKNTPIYWGHGIEDTQVDYKTWKGLAEVFAGQLGLPFRAASSSMRVSGEEIQKNGPLALHFHSYEGLEHWMNKQEIQDLAVWLYVLLPEVSRVFTPASFGAYGVVSKIGTSEQ